MIKHYILRSMLGLLLSGLQLSAMAQITTCVSLYGGNSGGNLLTAYNSLPPQDPSIGGGLDMFAWTANDVGVPVFNAHSAFKFDFSSIPANSTITSASLYLYAKPGNGVRPNQATFSNNSTPDANAGLLLPITKEWNTATTKWGNDPTTTTYRQVEIAASTNDNQDYILDMTELVKFWTSTPDSNFGVMGRIKNETPYNCLEFYGSEAGIDSALLMRLDVCYIANDCFSFFGGNTDGNMLSTYNSLPPFGPAIGQGLDMFAWTANDIGIPVFDAHSAFKFNLSSIPADATIESAKLYLYAKPANGIRPGQATFSDNSTADRNAGLLLPITKEWNTATAIWGNDPISTTYRQVELPASTSDNQDYVVDMADLVKFWVSTPDSNFGVLGRIKNETPYNCLEFYGSEPGIEPGLRMHLDVCYTKSLPLLLTSLQGSLYNQSAKLWWSTQNEKNIASITLERSYNGTTFNAINSVPVFGYSGNHSYEYTDNSFKQATNRLYYRLKIMDKDGKKSYSKVLVLTVAKANTEISVFPNPAREYIQLSIKANIEQQATVKILDVSGRTIITRQQRLANGTNTIMVNGLDKLAKGTYIVQIIANGKTVTRKLTLN